MSETQEMSQKDKRAKTDEKDGNNPQSNSHFSVNGTL